ncbi:hypothetical protein ACLB2K_034760 [Fragaria x ananassa]
MKTTLVLLLFVVSAHQVHNTTGCDVSKGSWVYDDSYPLYNASSCPFILKAFDCVGNGRPDKDYLKYRWKPSECNSPTFNGTDLLMRFKGKSIMFVGDSLSSNQWQSLACMVYTSTSPLPKYTLFRQGELSTFVFPEYNFRLLFSRNPLIVDIVNTKAGRVLKLDSISLESQQLWKGTDVVIFDTWHWWLHVGRKQPWDVIQVGNQTYEDMDRLVAYEKALNTWATWVDSNVNPAKTKVFFQGVSPDHQNASDWTLNPNSEAMNCTAESEPLLQAGSEYPRAHPAEQVAEKVLGSMSKPARLLNVTRLSELRKDGHPSVYGLGGRRGLDCTHWCLSGVPDTWNVLLYAALTESYTD